MLLLVLYEVGEVQLKFKYFFCQSSRRESIGRSNPFKFTAARYFMMVEQAFQFIYTIFTISAWFGMIKWTTGLCAVGEKFACCR